MLKNNFNLKKMKSRFPSIALGLVAGACMVGSAMADLDVASYQASAPGKAISTFMNIIVLLMGGLGAIKLKGDMNKLETSDLAIRAGSLVGMVALCLGFIDGSLITTIKGFIATAGQ